MSEGISLVIRGIVMVKRIKASSKVPGQVDRQIEVATRNGFKRANVDQASYDACPEVGQPALMICNVGRIEKGEYGATNATEIVFQSIKADVGAAGTPAEGSARTEGRRAA